MPYEITVTRRFAAAHQLRLYDGSLEPIHGHNWRVRVAVAAPQLDAIGVVMDFHELERQLDAIVTPLHNRHLNELPAFAIGELVAGGPGVDAAGALNPTAENVALHVGRSLRLPAGVAIVSVEVWETDDCSAVYRPG